MPDESTPESNAGRLLTYLKPDSFAARIVVAYACAAGDGRTTAIEKIVRDRLAEIASGYNENQ